MCLPPTEFAVAESEAALPKFARADLQKIDAILSVLGSMDSDCVVGKAVSWQLRNQGPELRDTHHFWAEMGRLTCWKCASGYSAGTSSFPELHIAPHRTTRARSS